VSVRRKEGLTDGLRFGEGYSTIRHVFVLATTLQLAQILILGAFAKLRKATIGFVMFVRPSVRTEQLGPHWTDFHEISHEYL
jgi:hypothetical protein